MTPQETSQAVRNALEDFSTGSTNDRSIKTTLTTPVTIDPGQVTIGAVILKDATSATEAKIKTDGVDNALVITQNSQPLPVGAATSAKQDDIITDLGILNGNLEDISSNTNDISSKINGNDTIHAGSLALKLDNIYDDIVNISSNTLDIDAHTTLLKLIQDHTTDPLVKSVFTDDTLGNSVFKDINDDVSWFQKLKSDLYDIRNLTYDVQSVLVNGVNESIGTQDNIRPNNIIQIGGNNGTNIFALLTDNTGKLQVDATVDTSSLATEDTLSTIKNDLESIIQNNGDATNGKVAVMGTIRSDNFIVPIPVNTLNQLVITDEKLDLSIATVGDASPSNAILIGARFTGDNSFADLTINAGSSLRVVDEFIGSSIGTNGATTPLNSQLIAGSDGTNIQPLLVDAFGKIQTNTIQYENGVTGPATIGNALIFNDTNGDINTLVSTAKPLPSLIYGQNGGSSIGVNVNGFGQLIVQLQDGQQTATSTNVTASGSVAAGTTSIVFETDATFVGTINGLTRAGSRIYSFEAAHGKTLPAIAYTITGGSINIDKLV